MDIVQTLLPTQKLLSVENLVTMNCLISNILGTQLLPAVARWQPRHISVKCSFLMWFKVGLHEHLPFEVVSFLYMLLRISSSQWSAVICSWNKYADGQPQINFCCLQCFKLTSTTVCMYLCVQSSCVSELLHCTLSWSLLAFPVPHLEGCIWWGKKRLLNLLLHLHMWTPTWVTHPFHCCLLHGLVSLVQQRRLTGALQHPWEVRHRVPIGSAGCLSPCRWTWFWMPASWSYLNL